jgi:hypothetical protein
VDGFAEGKLALEGRFGGARRDRTADLLHAMQALSQLSYGPLNRYSLVKSVVDNPSSGNCGADDRTLTS